MAKSYRAKILRAKTRAALRSPQVWRRLLVATIMVSFAAQLALGVVDV